MRETLPPYVTVALTLSPTALAAISLSFATLLDLLDLALHPRGLAHQLVHSHH